MLELILAMRQQGWLWTEEMIWHKKNCYPGKWPNRFRDAWERLLQFIKQKHFTMYQDAVMVPTGDWAKSRLKNLSDTDRIRDESKVGSGFGKKIENWIGRAMVAIYQATVPWCSILVRRAFGVAGAAHQSTGRFNIRYAWPSGEWGSLPIAGGLEAAYKAEIEAASDPAAKLAEIETRLKQFTSPFRTAEQFLIEEIIDPRETRSLLCEFANLASPLRETGKSAFGMRP